MFSDERAKLAAEQFIRNAKNPRNEIEIWRLTAEQIERQEQATADDLTHAFRSARSWPACRSGPCDGGRKICPSPDACRLSETGLKRVYKGWAVVLAVVAVLLGVLLYR